MLGDEQLSNYIAECVKQFLPNFGLCSTTFSGSLLDHIGECCHTRIRYVPYVRLKFEWLMCVYADLYSTKGPLLFWPWASGPAGIFSGISARISRAFVEPVPVAAMIKSGISDVWSV
jgi:hypothetical protein